MCEGDEDLSADDLFSWAIKQPAKGIEFDKKHASEMAEARDAREKDRCKKASKREQKKKEVDARRRRQKRSKERNLVNSRRRNR